MNYIEGLGQKAQKAKKSLATASTGQKNEILTRIAAKLLENQEQILAENEKDIANARENGISETMVDRLRLTPERIQGISDACIQLTNLEDPVGEIIEGSTRPNGMKISKIRVPMGVVGIIYESRPNVTVDKGKQRITRKTGLEYLVKQGEKKYSVKLPKNIQIVTTEEPLMKKAVGAEEVETVEINLGRMVRNNAKRKDESI